MVPIGVIVNQPGIEFSMECIDGLIAGVQYLAEEYLLHRAVPWKRTKMPLSAASACGCVDNRCHSVPDTSHTGGSRCHKTCTRCRSEPHAPAGSGRRNGNTPKWSTIADASSCLDECRKPKRELLTTSCKETVPTLLKCPTMKASALNSR